MAYPQYQNILFHVYRSVDDKPDSEGKYGAKALALFVANQLKNSPKDREPINILFGADLSEISGGIPLHYIYKLDFIREATKLGISTLMYNLITPDTLGLSPVDTKSELAAFQSYLELEHKYDNSVVFARAPHIERIQMLSNRLGLSVDYLSHEEILMNREINPFVRPLFYYYNDYANFNRAEQLKIWLMNKIDYEGTFLEVFSRITPRVKDALLDFGGHKKA